MLNNQIFVSFPKLDTSNNPPKRLFSGAAILTRKPQAAGELKQSTDPCLRMFVASEIFFLWLHIGPLTLMIGAN